MLIVPKGIERTIFLKSKFAKINNFFHCIFLRTYDKNEKSKREAEKGTYNHGHRERASQNEKTTKLYPYFLEMENVFLLKVCFYMLILWCYADCIMADQF